MCLEGTLWFTLRRRCGTEGCERWKLLGPPPHTHTSFLPYFRDIALSKQMGLTQYTERQRQVQSISKSRGRKSLRRVRNVIAPPKPNHEPSKSSQSVPVTGVMALRFTHLFSVVHLGSPSMTYMTINSKRFVPECEQIYFRYRCWRKEAWVGEKTQFFPAVIWLAL